jgi:hypothetical protein
VTWNVTGRKHREVFPMHGTSTIYGRRAAASILPSSSPAATHAARQLRKIARELSGWRAYRARKRRVLYREIVTDADLDLLVAEIGLERVLGALDRATEPPAGSVFATSRRYGAARVHA